MKKTRQQLAIVVDSYGGTVGLLTMEDALEVLVGDIWTNQTTSSLILPQKFTTAEVRHRSITKSR